MKKQYYVYILTTKNKRVLYTGITNNLVRRVWEHKNKARKSFTSRYSVDNLVYYEVYSNAYAAIKREKQIKAGSRKKKELLINNINFKWKDLYDDL